MLKFTRTVLRVPTADQSSVGTCSEDTDETQIRMTEMLIWAFENHLPRKPLFPVVQPIVIVVYGLSSLGTLLIESGSVKDADLN